MYVSTKRLNYLGKDIVTRHGDGALLAKALTGKTHVATALGIAACGQIVACALPDHGTDGSPLRTCADAVTQTALETGPADPR